MCVCVGVFGIWWCLCNVVALLFVCFRQDSVVVLWWRDVCVMFPCFRIVSVMFPCFRDVSVFP